MEAEDIKPDISTLVQTEISSNEPPPETAVDVKVEEQKNGELPEEGDQNNVPPEISTNDDNPKNDEQQNDDHKPDDLKSDDQKNDDSPEEGDEDEDDDNIKVTIEDYDFKAIQKQAQPAKQAAPLVLETNQEPIDISTLDDKPWRKPGADINDYFNYGFDETTWRIYCDKQSQMRQMANEINEPQETFKIPVVHAAPMVQQNVMPYLDERMAHVMDNRNAPLAQPVAMQLHHQPHHQHHNQQHHQHQMSGGGGRIKVEDDVKKYERRHDRSSERRHSSKSRERRHSKSRERDREKEKDKDKERKRSRSRERRSKETRSRPRSRSREDERRSKRHKSSRHA